jgi:hypothetical protein
LADTSINNNFNNSPAGAAGTPAAGLPQLPLLGPTLMQTVAPHASDTYNNWFSWLGWLSYSFQRVSLSGVKTRLLYLSAVILVNIFAGGCLYRFASGQSWSSSLFKTYGVLFRAPGVGVFAEETVAASLVLNVIFIFSLFVFAAFLGMISDEIKQQVRVLSSPNVLSSMHLLFVKGHSTETRVCAEPPFQHKLRCMG